MLNVALTCLLIIVARIGDVSLGTIRTMFVVQGRRWLAFVLGFFEVLIWLMIVANVITNVQQQPVYALAYALGYALGNYVGVTIEQRLALGRQVVRIISRQGHELARAMREKGLRVTQFDGLGRDGPVQELCIETNRRATAQVVERARALDPKCYYMIDDIRHASTTDVELTQPTGWRSVLKKK